MKTITIEINRELKEIEEMFMMGLITPQERFRKDYEAKQTLKMLYRMIK